jgi:hypothetical protein
MAPGLPSRAADRISTSLDQHFTSLSYPPIVFLTNQSNIIYHAEKLNDTNSQNTTAQQRAVSNSLKVYTKYQQISTYLT